jgi:4'-phosphopantetheinyl transferase
MTNWRTSSSIWWRVDVWLGAAQPGARQAAEALGIRAAAAMLGVPGSGLGVTHDQAARPRLTGHAGHPAPLHLSVSHGREVVAAAVTALGPVGVDLEPARRIAALDVARRWFPEDEAAWLAGQPDRLRGEAFLGLWTQKEAIAKALGTGLRGGAGLRQRVRLILPPPGPAGMRLTVLPGTQGLTAAVARVAGGAILAVACVNQAAAGAPVTVRQAGQLPPG